MRGLFKDGPGDQPDRYDPIHIISELRSVAQACEEQADLLLRAAQALQDQDVTIDHMDRAIRLARARIIAVETQIREAEARMEEVLIDLQQVNLALVPSTPPQQQDD